MTRQPLIASLLHEEHVQTISALQRLEEFLMGQGGKRPPELKRPENREVVGGITAGIAAEVQRHFGFEETYLFPLLAEQGQMGMVGMLAGEHQVILPLASGLARRAEAAINAGAFTETDWAAFHGDGLDLCEREIFHIQKEEMGLLGAIAAFVDNESDERLSALYSQMVAATAE
ncbi:MAG TPA: hemerythrin domain-containing protein [Rhodospirillaceae bacterium]|nr:hemerythrin domain-containing protein [Rhodospirillaceae bacterium]